ncbi:hypothetical protein ACIA5D_42440 [Actinoplanes sp. NPDC051513]|uniref:hypothetical protein n=1 Tax=Actinoplanes sp. NPDC051513 TaxID=3363908 RepID=UPI0037A86A8B
MFIVGHPRGNRALIGARVGSSVTLLLVLIGSLTPEGSRSAAGCSTEGSPSRGG